MKFKEGDRVIRDCDGFPYEKEGVQVGTIIRAYDWTSEDYGYYPELFEVQFDNGRISKGFLPCCLESYSKELYDESVRQRSTSVPEDQTSVEERA